jgi:hypothetical protein
MVGDRMDGNKFIDAWLDCEQPNHKCPSLWVLSEKSGTLKTVIPAMCEAVKDHFVGRTFWLATSSMTFGSIAFTHAFPHFLDR